MPIGGKLTLETANVSFDKQYTRQHADVEPGDYVMLAISDTGHGMDTATKARIFEPFFTTKDKGQGTGLGLATVYGIINQSGGHIWVYSEPGHGTTFKIYLPRLKETLETTDQDHVPARVTSGSETILLVEDEDLVRELAYEILVAEGYTVLETSQGAEALNISEHYPHRIHLLLTDVVMPGGISGLELAERLAPVRRNMKVLYISGYTDNAMVQHSILTSTAGFLEKPFTPNGLAHKIRDVLDQT
jgi:CheY-like chemotaxis protein